MPSAMPPAPGPPLTSPRVFKLHYGFFFGVLGLYVLYLPPYLRARGLDGAQIGLIFALLPLMKIALPPLTGPWADRMGSPARIVQASGVGSFLAAVALAGADGLAAITLAMAAFAVFRAPTPPLVDALALSQLPAQGETYGRARLVGSAAYAVVVLVVGRVLDRVGLDPVPALLALGLAGVAAVSFGFPTGRAGPVSEPRTSLGLLRSNPALRRVLVCTALHAVSGAGFVQFFTIHLEDLGHPDPYGLSSAGWALGVTCEVVILHWGHVLLERVGAVRCLLVAYAATAVRWFLTGTLESAAGLVAVQSIHGLTFGLFFLATVSLVQATVERGEEGTAQSLFSAAAFGVGNVIGALVAGQAYDALGGDGLFLLSGGLEVGTLVVGVALLGRWRHASLRAILSSSEEPGDGSPP